MSASTVVVHTGESPRLLSYLDPLAMTRRLWSLRALIATLAVREVRQRYRTTSLGFLWALAPPLVMLAVYTFVFGVVFDARWGEAANGSRGEFALALFAGIVLYGVFAEVVTRAPELVVENPNYVKKVVFPLEILVVSRVLGALFTAVVGYGVWAVGWVVVERSLPHATALWLPLVLLPVLLATAGVAWGVAAFGVFVRDIGPAVNLAVQMLFFLTPIFYPLEVVPAAIRPLLLANPLTHAVLDARRVLMWGQPPDSASFALSWIVSAAVAVAGYAVFMKSRRAFADVL